MGIDPHTNEASSGLLGKIITAGSISAMLLFVIGTPGPVKGLKPDFSFTAIPAAPVDSILNQVKELDMEELAKRISKNDLKSIRELTSRQLTSLQNGFLIKYFSKDLSLEQLVHSVLLSAPGETAGLLSKVGVSQPMISSICPNQAEALEVAGRLIAAAHDKGERPGPVAGGDQTLRALAAGCAARYISSIPQNQAS